MSNENPTEMEKIIRTSPIQSNSEEVYDNFEDMNLKEDLLRGIYAYGFEKPTEIQQRAIIPCMQGHDVIAQARPNAGKTTMLCISILQKIDTTINDCQALILVTSRILAEEMQTLITKLGNYMNLRCQKCIGGTNIRENMRQLEEGAQVVVGTPGRVYDMITRKYLRMDRVKVFVLDEADEILSRQFKEQIHKVSEHLLEDAQIIFLLATMHKDVLKVGKKLMKNRLPISVKIEEKTFEGIKQYYVLWKVKTGKSMHDEKYDMLCKVFEALNTSITPIIVFCATRWEVIWLKEKMAQFDDTLSFLHADIDQAERQKIMEGFRSGSIRTLITTAVARNIDLRPVLETLIINYGLSATSENYIRRMGLGKTVINIVTEEEKILLNKIAQSNNFQVEEMLLAWDQNEEPTSEVLNDERDIIADSEDDLSDTGDQNGTHAKVEGDDLGKTNSEIAAVDSFEVMNLKDELLRGIYAYGFKKPTEIQQRAIIPCMQGYDIIAEAWPSPGKTAMLCISILQKIDTTINECQALIVVRTRLIAEEIQKVIMKLGIYMNLRCHLCIGGTNVHQNVHQLLEDGTSIHVVVGTPGHVHDVISRKCNKFKLIKLFVLDDADTMLNGDLKKRNTKILELLPQKVQIIMLLTTLTENVLEISKQFMKNPVQLFVEKEEKSMEDIKQYYVLVKKTTKKFKHDERFHILCRLFKTLNTGISHIKVFCNSKRQVDWLQVQMAQFDGTVSFLHGGIGQEYRKKIIEDFRSGSIRILITTDIEIKIGLPPESVPLIINYGFPVRREDYIRRIGLGEVVINFVTEGEKIILNRITLINRIPIEEMPEDWNYNDEPSSSNVPNDDFRRDEIADSEDDLSDTAEQNEDPPDDLGKTNSEIAAVSSFEAMNLKEELLRGIYAYGFEKPTEIQQRAIIPCMQGHDIIARARPNAGKTTMLCISILQKIDPTIEDCQVLILVKMRVLAEEMQKVMMKLGKYMNLRCHICIGGTSTRQDMFQHGGGVQVVVGTPGCVYDMIIRRSLRMDRIKMFILDEADEILFRELDEQIHMVFKHLPEDVQVIFLSATMYQVVFEVGKKFMKNPVLISVKIEEETLEGIKQYYVLWKMKTEKSKHYEKYDTLCKVFKALNTSITPIIVFCTTRWEVNWLKEQMAQFDDTLSFLHGDIDQAERERIMDCFRSGSIRILITTEWARNIGLKPVLGSLIINYGLSLCREDYIRRMGLGKTIINIVTKKEKKLLYNIAKSNNLQVEKMPEVLDQNEEPSISSDKIIGLENDLPKTEKTLRGTTQYYVLVKKKDKHRKFEEWDILCKLFKTFRTDYDNIIVFCNKIRQVNWLRMKTGRSDNTISFLHSYTDQDRKKEIMKGFSTGSIRILITTELARNIGLKPVLGSLIINYRLPEGYSNYIDRMGFGKTVINMVTEEEKVMLNDIAQLNNFEVEKISGSWDQIEEHEESNKISSLKDDLQKTKKTLEGTKQYYVLWKVKTGKSIHDEKWDTLRKVFKALNTSSTRIIVFCATRWEVNWLKEQMAQFGDTVSFLHERIDQKKSEKIIKRFKSGSIRILITTDIARSLGLQPMSVPLIINYGSPRSREEDANHIHRMGFGKTVINFVTEKKMCILNEIAQLHHIQVEEMPEAWDPIEEPSTSGVLNDKSDEISDSENDTWNTMYQNESPPSIDEEDWDETDSETSEVDSFQVMNLKEELLRGIYAYGFEKPTLIQQRTMLPCIEGQDIIAKAWSNAGKTTMLCISILQKIDTTINNCQALILVKTRILAEEMQALITKLGNYMNLRCLICIGGTDFRKDVRQLEEGAQVVIGTPGRVYDMILQKFIKLDLIEIFVLDDADTMLTEDFQISNSNIMVLLPEKVQIVMLSNTLTENVLKVSKQFMKNPVLIIVEKDKKAMEDTRQYFVQVEQKPKQHKREVWDKLCELFKTLNTGFTHIIVFCNAKWQVGWLKVPIAQFYDKVSFLLSDTDQKERQRIMEDFRSGSIQILITTSMARTISLQPTSIPLIINYGVPKRREDHYVNHIHRMSFGKTIINLVTEEEKIILGDIARLHNIQIVEMFEPWNHIEELSTSNVLNDESVEISDSEDDLSDTENQNEIPPRMGEDDLEKRSFEIAAVHSFEDMNLKEELLRGILGYGFEKPTLIQQLATIPCMRGGRDFIIGASPILHQIDSTIDDCQVLILERNRTLAEETLKMISGLAEFLDLKFHLCIGATNVIQEKLQLKKKGAQIIVGTVGRVQDMVKRGCIKLDTIKVFILDDAEKSFSSFSEKRRRRKYEFCERLPKHVQIILVSTAITENVLQFSKEFMKNPVNISVVN